MDVEIESAVRDAVGEAAKESADFGAERLEELGWTELLDADAESAVRTFLDVQGRLVLTSRVLDSIVLGAVDDERFAWPKTAVVYPLPGRTGCLLDDGTVRGIAFSADAEVYLAVVADDDGYRLDVVPAEALSLERVDGIDPTAGLVSVSAPTSSLERAGIDGERAAAAVAAGRRALSHELIGLGARMIDVVVGHVAVREQFNRPLGANQAVQHKLADAKVLLEAATVIAEEAWETPTAFAAVAAKAQASRAFDVIAANGQQLLGAIGYTWEHEWRRYVRRGFLLTVLLGSADELEREIGAELVAQGVPRLGALFPGAES